MGQLGDPLEHLLCLELFQSQEGQAQLVFLKKKKKTQNKITFIHFLPPHPVYFGLIYSTEQHVQCGCAVQACGREDVLWAGPNPFEGLGHLSQEVLGQLYGLIDREVQTAVSDLLLDPAWQLPSFISPGIALARGEQGGGKA